MVLEQLALRSSDETFYCSTNTVCDGVECSAVLLGITYETDAVLLPCSSPVAIHLSLKEAGGPAYVDRVIDHSTVIELSGVEIIIELDQLANGIGLEVSLAS